MRTGPPVCSSPTSRCRPTTSTMARGGRGPERQGEPHRSVLRLRLRARRAAHEEQVVGRGWWGKTDVRIRTINHLIDRTILENTAFKTNAQISDTVRANFTFFQGEKKKFGRDASPLVAPESTVDQDGPTRTYKGEANWIPSGNLFLTARGAYVKKSSTSSRRVAGRRRSSSTATVFSPGRATTSPRRGPRRRSTWTETGSADGTTPVRRAWRRVDDFTDFSWGGGVINLEVPIRARGLHHGDLSPLHPGEPRELRQPVLTDTFTTVPADAQPRASLRPHDELGQGG